MINNVLVDGILMNCWLKVS